MRHVILAAALVAAAPAAWAGPIERACIQSNRSAGNRALCGCIQQAADLTLSTREQSRAAKFFTDPHQAQVVRQSDRRTDEEFWQRYKMFGETAEAYCGGA